MCCRCCCFLCAEVERFLHETEEYINKLTKKLVQYKAEEQAGDAVQEAIAEVRVQRWSHLWKAQGSWHPGVTSIRCHEHQVQAINAMMAQLTAPASCLLCELFGVRLS